MQEYRNHTGGVAATYAPHILLGPLIGTVPGEAIGKWLGSGALGGAIGGVAGGPQPLEASVTGAPVALASVAAGRAPTAEIEDDRT